MADIRAVPDSMSDEDIEALFDCLYGNDTQIPTQNTSVVKVEPQYAKSTKSPDYDLAEEAAMEKARKTGMSVFDCGATLMIGDKFATKKCFWACLTAALMIYSELLPENKRYDKPWNDMACVGDNFEDTLRLLVALCDDKSEEFLSNCAISGTTGHITNHIADMAKLLGVSIMDYDFDREEFYNTDGDLGIVIFLLGGHYYLPTFQFTLRDGKFNAAAFADKHGLVLQKAGFKRTPVPRDIRIQELLFKDWADQLGSLEL